MNSELTPMSLCLYVFLSKKVMHRELIYVFLSKKSRIVRIRSRNSV